MSDNLFEPQEGQQSEQASTVDPNQGQQAPQAQEPNQSQSVDPNTLFANQLAEIKSEDGRQKYADVNTALSSIPHAQSHISSLEKQVAQLQEELTKRQGMEEVLERIKATPETNTEQPSANSLDAAQLSEAFNAFADQREQARIAAENEVAFSNELRSLYGEKAKEIMETKAQEIGISTAMLQSLAQKSPKAALKYFEGGPAQAAQPTVPSNNTSSLTPPTTPNKAEEARAKLFGKRDPNIEKWRSAGSNLT